MALFPVNPAVIQWARLERNLSLEEAAPLVSLTPADLEQLERGLVAPTLTQLRRMARAYRLPLATLGHSEPLPPREILPDYRTLDGRPARLGREASIALDRARQVQEFARELLEEQPDLSGSGLLRSVSLADNPESVAGAERAQLLTDADQTRLADAAALFNLLRSRIETLGILVLVFKVSVEDFRGFTLTDGVAPPLIGINDIEGSASANAFSLMHEYCHVLLAAPGISDPLIVKNSIERFCNRFAAAFLMPRGLVSGAMPPASTPQEWSPEQVRNAARRLRVSQQALALRLEELSLASEGFYDRWLGRFSEPPRVRQSGGPPVPYARRALRRLGSGYVGMVLTALGRGAISDLEAYRLLKVKPQHFGALAAELRNRRVTADANAL